MPRTWESRRPIVTASWLTVPKPPRRLSGAISLMYMGTREVLSPGGGGGGGMLMVVFVFIIIIIIIIIIVSCCNDFQWIIVSVLRWYYLKNLKILKHFKNLPSFTQTPPSWIQMTSYDLQWPWMTRHNLPQLIPMTSLPMMSISKEFDICENPMRQAPPTPRRLLSSRPFFLQTEDTFERQVDRQVDR